MRTALSSLLSLSCLCLGLCLARPAQAQYKNTSFGLDLGGTLGLNLGSIEGEDGVLKAPEDRNMRLRKGQRIGFEVGLKMQSDHWWWINRFNLQAYQYNSPKESDNSGVGDIADRLAASSVGTLLGIQPQTGIRYTLATDRTRPYLQGSVSYMRLFTLKNSANNTCTGDGPYTCVGGGTNLSEFLPHQNIVSLNFEPGIEFIVSRDVAVHVLFDFQRWIFFNGPDANFLSLALGMTFFS